MDAYWGQMRLAKSEVIGMSLVREIPSSNAPLKSSFDEAIGTGQVECLSLLDALKVYLNLKGKDRPKTFRLAAERSCNYLISLVYPNSKKRLRSAMRSSSGNWLNCDARVLV